MSLVKRNRNVLFPPALFDDFFNKELFNWENGNFSSTLTTVPSVNIKENANNFEVEVAAPGMDAEQSWAALRRQLEQLMHEIREEIRAYPAPIPACDAQFNRLLELRRLLPEELARLEAAAGSPAHSVAAFVQASPCRAELEVLTVSDPSPPTVAA